MLVILAVTEFIVPKFRSKNDGVKITAEIRNERIAVLPFKNNTNDADLDILGDMSADWINPVG